MLDTQTIQKVGTLELYLDSNNCLEECTLVVESLEIANLVAKILSTELDNSQCEFLYYSEGLQSGFKTQENSRYVFEIVNCMKAIKSFISAGLEVKAIPNCY